MEKASARNGLVEELRAFARQTGVAQVRDDSSRAKVEAMFQSIIASAAADVKTEAMKFFEMYQSSFTVERLCFRSPAVFFNSVFRKSRHVLKRTFWCAQRQAKTFTSVFRKFRHFL